MVTSTKAVCTECGFTWAFRKQRRGKGWTKRELWGPTVRCIDNYDRAWRIRGYDRHEVVGTRRRGKQEYYVVGCFQSMNTISASTDSPPDEIYCPDCDRSGPLGPMVKRWQLRREEEDDG